MDSVAHDRFVSSTVRRMLRRLYLPPWLDPSDLIQEGHIAALKALRLFDPNKGIPFELWPYAKRRICGSVIDCLRGYADSPPRGGGPALLRCEIEDVGATLADASCASNPERVLDDQESLRRFANLIRGLPPRTRQIFVGLYVHELQATQIAAALGISKGRVSQIHSAALLRMKAELIGLPSRDGFRPPPSFATSFHD